MSFHCSRVQWQRALHHSNRRLALCLVMLGLCAAAQTWKLISWSSRWTVIVPTLLPEAVGNLSVATEDRWFLCAMRLSTQQSRPVSFCGRPFRGWAVVAPRRIHFTITALTVDRGSSRAEVWRADLLERWHPMTVLHWNELSSSARPFYCQRLSMEIAWLCARSYIPVSNGCVWNSQIYSFEGVSTYVCVYFGLIQ